jgi:hypothetical protein
VLIALLARPRHDLHLRELIRQTGGSASGVQREVGRLEELGLVASERTAEGRRVLRVVDGHELLEPLQALVDAEVGHAGTAGGSGVGACANAAGGGPSEALLAAVHPRLRPRLPAVLAVLRAAEVKRAVLFGSSAASGGSPAPRDLDVLVHFGGPAKGRAARYFALRRALEQAVGLPVDLVEDEAIENPYLRDEIARTGVVLLAAA